MTEAPTKNQKKPTPSPCKCPDRHDPYCCCGLECFERPNYFCGHLLTDADLSLEQKYVVEKNKLRNRSLHGHGVVCGLRIWCDPNCCGNIRVGEGYAIDNCGNDLVVCSEMTFPFIEEARKCGYIDPVQSRKEHRKEQRGEDCSVKECFYVALCYEEEKAEYTTPFQAGCNGGPAACEPTRIREKVYIKILKELPKRSDIFREMEERIEHCYRILTEGEFSDALRQQADSVLTGANPGNQGGAETAQYDAFCRLVVLFRKWLRCHPSASSCGVEESLRAIVCPDDARDRQGTQRAYQELLDLVHEYIYGCIRSELAFSCKAPDCAECIVLGAVEVVDGCVTHVCNTHRQYVWSFANFFEVLLYEVLDNRQEGGRDHQSCCPEKSIDLEHFFTLFRHDRWAGRKSALSAVSAARHLRSSLRHAFDFTESLAVTPRVFLRKSYDEAAELGKSLGLNVIRWDAAQSAPSLDPIASLLAHFLKNSARPDRIYAVVNDQGEVVAAIPELSAPAASVAAAPASSEEMRRKLDEMKATIESMRASLSKVEPKPEPGDHP